jgi:hypothetical protein
MSIPQTVADILDHHVTFQLECIDRMYLNVYVPMLQSEGGVVKFFRQHRGQQFASSALMEPMTKALVASMDRFAKQQQIPVVQFQKGQRKDDVMKEHLTRFHKPEGVVFIGKAQEKTPVFRTQKRRNPETGQTYPWIVRSTAMVNHFYCYCVDQDFGPFFLKFCSYFPYTAKLCLNGHEYAKCQLRKEGIGFKALDNGFVSCPDRDRLQTICDQLRPTGAGTDRRFAAALAGTAAPSVYTRGSGGRLPLRPVHFTSRVFADTDSGPSLEWAHAVRRNHPGEPGPRPP